MTREEIINKTKNYQGDKLSFIDGAEWILSLLKIDKNQLEKFEEDYEESLPKEAIWNEYCDDGEGIHSVCSACEIEKAYIAGCNKILELIYESKYRTI